MKKKNTFVRFVLGALLAIPNSLALAHHDHGGSAADNLATEAQELNSIVSSTWVRYPVKMAVSQFASQANALASCMDGMVPNGSDVEGGASETPLDHGSGDNCSYQLSRTQSAFYSVERYLSDTYYDLPQVYSQYLSVKSALGQVR